MRRAKRLICAVVVALGVAASTPVHAVSIDLFDLLGNITLLIPGVFNVPTPIFVSGPTQVQRGDLMMGGSGDRIDTEILSMSLTGVSLAGPVTVTLNPTAPPSTGAISDLNPNGMMDFPAESFFDIFVEIGIPSYGPYFSQQLRIQGQVTGLPLDHGDMYTGPVSGPVTLLDGGNAPAGQITAVSLESQPVPEPASLILLGSGLVGVATAAWRRRR